MRLGRLGTIVISGTLLSGSAFAGGQKQQQQRTNAPPAAKANGQTSQKLSPGVTKIVIQHATDAQQRIKELKADMLDDIHGRGDYAKRGHGDTPLLEPVTMNASLLKTRRAAVEINEHNIGGPHAIYEVSAVPANGDVTVKLLIPVSGHVGLASAKKYAKTNKYDVSIEDENGKTIQSMVVNATGMITEQDVTLPFGKGKRFQVSFAPRGSGGVSGYSSGRIAEFKLAGK